jgi:hypothetical protein
MGPDRATRIVRRADALDLPRPRPEDYVQDITWRFTFPVDSAGTQHVQVAELTGKEATDRNDTDPASGVWGQLSDQTAAVVKAGGTFSKGIHGRSTALAYGAWAADTILPNVIPFVPGTNALWDPWQGSHNAKGLREDAFDNATKMVLNQDFHLPADGNAAPRLTG